MKREHPPLKYMSNFKAFAIDYEYYLTLSDKPQSVCLTERQMYVLSVQNSYTYWLTRWYNTDDITQKTVEFIAAEIEGLLMCGCGIPVPSITDILNAQTYNNSTSIVYENTYNTWVESEENYAAVAPNLDFGSGDQGDISTVVCFALQMTLEAIRQAALQIKQGSVNDSKDLTRQLGAAFAGLSGALAAGSAASSAITVLVGFVGGPWLLFGLALAGVGLTIASIVMPADVAVFEDDAAFEDVMCVIGNNMSGSAPTRGNFIGALAGAGFTPGSHQAQLAAIFQTYLDDLTVYLQFLNNANQIFALVDASLLPPCPCAPVEDCEDLTEDAFQWYPSNYLGTPAPGDWGDYIPGQGLAPHVYYGTIFQFFWSRHLVPDEAISSITIDLNETVTEFIIGKIGIGGIGYSGAPTTSITFDETSHPDFFPVSFEAELLYMTFPTNLAPTSSLRVVQTCYVYV